MRQNLFYEYVNDIAERRGPYREAHLERIRAERAAGRIVMWAGGPGQLPVGLDDLNHLIDEAGAATIDWETHGGVPMPGGARAEAVAVNASRALGWAGRRGRFRSLPLANGWTRVRDMPAPEGRSFHSLWSERQKGRRTR